MLQGTLAARPTSNNTQIAIFIAEIESKLLLFEKGKTSKSTAAKLNRRNFIFLLPNFCSDILAAPVDSGLSWNCKTIVLGGGEKKGAGWGGGEGGGTGEGGKIGRYENNKRISCLILI